MIKIKYNAVMNFNFAQAMQKITSTPLHGKVASEIYKVTTQLEQARKKIMKEYKTEITEPYAKKDEKGNPIFEDGQGIQVDDAMVEPMEVAVKEFDKRMVELKCSPLTPAQLADVKLSALDLAALKEVYSDYVAPEEDSNVVSLPPLGATKD